MKDFSITLKIDGHEIEINVSDKEGVSVAPKTTKATPATPNSSNHPLVVVLDLEKLAKNNAHLTYGSRIKYLDDYRLRTPNDIYVYSEHTVFIATQENGKMRLHCIAFDISEGCDFYLSQEEFDLAARPLEVAQINLKNIYGTNLKGGFRVERSGTDTDYYTLVHPNAPKRVCACNKELCYFNNRGDGKVDLICVDEIETNPNRFWLTEEAFELATGPTRLFRLNLKKLYEFNTELTHGGFVKKKGEQYRLFTGLPIMPHTERTENGFLEYAEFAEDSIFRFANLEINCTDLICVKLGSGQHGLDKHLKLTSKEASVAIVPVSREE